MLLLLVLWWYVSVCIVCSNCPQDERNDRIRQPVSGTLWRYGQVNAGGSSASSNAVACGCGS